MIQLLWLLAIALILGYSWKQFKNYRPATPTFNTVITFDPEVYTDIRWYEIFRKVTRWEKFGAYSFKGITDMEAEALIHLIRTELDIPPEKFQVKVFPAETALFVYMVTFKKLPRPEIENYPHLAELGSWEKLGKKSYRLQINLTEEQLKEVLIQELQISADSFTVYDPANFAWTWFL